MPNPQCVTCKFFDRFARNPDYGLCRRYAPRPAWVNQDAECAFPWVKNSDWCGEYETDEEFLKNDNAQV